MTCSGLTLTHATPKMTKRKRLQIAPLKPGVVSSRALGVHRDARAAATASTVAQIQHDIVGRVAAPRWPLCDPEVGTVELLGWERLGGLSVKEQP